MTSEPNVAMHPTALAIRKSITVDVDQQRAFDAFTAGIDTWWPRDHHIGDSPMKEIFIEPKAGGRAYTMQVDGNECDWGSVLVWEPPDRLVLAWQITSEWKYDPTFVTEVDVTFHPQGPKQTLVELEHRHLERYAEAAEQMAEALGSDGGWSGSLKLFAAAAERTS